MFKKSTHTKPNPAALRRQFAEALDHLLADYVDDIGPLSAADELDQRVSIMKMQHALFSPVR